MGAVAFDCYALLFALCFGGVKGWGEGYFAADCAAVAWFWGVRLAFRELWMLCDGNTYSEDRRWRRCRLVESRGLREVFVAVGMGLVLTPCLYSMEMKNATKIQAEVKKFYFLSSGHLFCLI